MKEFLDEQAALINTPEFIAEDPVQFPRRFEKLQDIEIVSLLASHIAWGKRSMICRDADPIQEEKPVVDNEVKLPEESETLKK